jgi:hypothetical protein
LSHQNFPEPVAVSPTAFQASLSAEFSAHGYDSSEVSVGSAVSFAAAQNSAVTQHCGEISADELSNSFLQQAAVATFERLAQPPSLQESRGYCSRSPQQCSSSEHVDKSCQSAATQPCASSGCCTRVPSACVQSQNPSSPAGSRPGSECAEQQEDQQWISSTSDRVEIHSFAEATAGRHDARDVFAAAASLPWPQNADPNPGPTRSFSSFSISPFVRHSSREEGQHEDPSQSLSARSQLWEREESFAMRSYIPSTSLDNMNLRHELHIGAP